MFTVKAFAITFHHWPILPNKNKSKDSCFSCYLLFFVVIVFVIISQETLKQVSCLPPPSVTTCSGAGTGFNDHPALAASSYNLNWMESIPDDTPISAISIPGTHKSLSLYGPFKTYQIWTLDKQLKVGLRFFDVHTGIFSSFLKDINIGESAKIFQKNMRFVDALKIIFDFLDDSKSETVLLKVTIHGLIREAEVEQRIKVLLQKYKHRIWTESSIPNMKQARGKIVFLQSDTFHAGLKSHESNFFKGDKLNNIEAKLKDMKSRVCRDIVLTVPADVWRPKRLARTINKKFIDFIEEYKRDPSNQDCFGILSFNFPSAEMIKNIIQIKSCSCGLGSASEPESKTPEPESSTPEQKSLPPEPESKTPEPESSTSEPKSLPPEPESKTPEPKSSTPEQKSPPPEPKSPPPEPESKTPEPESSTPEPKSPPPEPESKTPEPESSTPEPKSPPPEPESKTPEPESSTPEPKSPPPEPESKTPEPESSTPESKSPPPEQESKTPEPESSTPEQKSPPPEPESKTPEPESTPE
ncbi:translation initiation factor IF-2-like, partial [Thunnus albacares]|uniref:translation initiation factor IF-2-like n=1 Tax=Thunnus albacares TaxID=8236 RepID=UPI001CF68495